MQLNRTCQDVKIEIAQAICDNILRGEQSVNQPKLFEVFRGAAPTTLVFDNGQQFRVDIVELSEDEKRLSSLEG